VETSKEIEIEAYKLDEFYEKLENVLREKFDVKLKVKKSKPQTEFTDYLNEIFFTTQSIIGTVYEAKISKNENELSIDNYLRLRDPFGIKLVLKQNYNLEKRIYSAKLTIIDKKERVYTLSDNNESQIPMVEHLLGITIHAKLID
jgi:hypothetical protein